MRDGNRRPGPMLRCPGRQDRGRPHGGDPSPPEAHGSMSTPTLHVSQHPAVLHKLAILRDETTEPKKFREVVRELSWLLGYEALADAHVRPLEVKTPIETMQGAALADRLGLVP